MAMLNALPSLAALMSLLRKLFAWATLRNGSFHGGASPVLHPTQYVVTLAPLYTSVL